MACPTIPVRGADVRTRQPDRSAVRVRGSGAIPSWYRQVRQDACTLTARPHTRCTSSMCIAHSQPCIHSREVHAVRRMSACRRRVVSPRFRSCGVRGMGQSHTSAQKHSARYAPGVTPRAWTSRGTVVCVPYYRSAAVPIVAAQVVPLVASRSAPVFPLYWISPTDKRIWWGQYAEMRRFVTLKRLHLIAPSLLFDFPF